MTKRQKITDAARKAKRLPAKVKDAKRDPTSAREIVAALLYAWHQTFGSQPMAMRHVLTNTDCRRLAMRLRSGSSARNQLVPHELANMLKPYIGQSCDGLTIAHAGKTKSTDGWRWRVTRQVARAQPAAATIHGAGEVTITTTKAAKLTITTGPDGVLVVTIA